MIDPIGLDNNHISYYYCCRHHCLLLYPHYATNSYQRLFHHIAFFSPFTSRTLLLLVQILTAMMFIACTLNICYMLCSISLINWTT
jgi:hypothetical protein